MNQQLEPVLEKFVNDDEIKEVAESTQIVQNPQQEQIKPIPIIEEQKQNIKDTKKSQKNKTKETKFSEKMEEQGKLNTKERKGSSYFSPSVAFLKPFDVIEEANAKSKEELKQKTEDLSLGKNIISKEETSDLENIQSIYGFNQNEEKDPVKMSLKNRLEELEKKKEEIKRQHNLDKEIYLKRIAILEKACNVKVDENKLKNLENTNKKNKAMIKEFKLKIELAEKEKIKDRQRFNDTLKNLLQLKSNLINEINELEILMKKSSFEDYDKYTRDNPTKIEKINFRPNDSRYLLTNEYETSRDEEESFSSYDKLNNINNTPDAFDFNRQNIYLNKTLNNNYSHLNTKNSKIPLGTNNDFNNEKININIQNKTFNKGNNTFIKGTEGSLSLKQKDLKQSQNNIINTNNININTNINNINNNTNNINNNNINNINNPPTDNKRIYPKDPDFINNDMILIRNEEDKDSDNFY